MCALQEGHTLFELRYARDSLRAKHRTLLTVRRTCAQVAKGRAFGRVPCGGKRILILIPSHQFRNVLELACSFRFDVNAAKRWRRGCWMNIRPMNAHSA
jgi:hypothetical protein